MDHQEQTALILKELNQKDCVGQELNELANKYRLDQEWKLALDYAHDSLVLCQRASKSNMQYRRSAGIATMHLGAIYHTKGTERDLQEAVRFYEQSVAYFSHDRHNRSVAHLAMGIVRRELEEWQISIEAFHSSLGILKGLDQRLHDVVARQYQEAVRLWDEQRAASVPDDEQASESAQTVNAITETGGGKGPVDVPSPPAPPPESDDGQASESAPMMNAITETGGGKGPVDVPPAPAQPPEPDAPEGENVETVTKWSWELPVAAMIVLIIFGVILGLIGISQRDTALQIVAAIIILVVVAVPLLALWILPPWLVRLGLLHDIREGEVAIIDVAGKTETRGAGLCFCFPIFYQLQAIVPSSQQSTTRIAQVADRNGKQVKVNLSLGYRAEEPVKAAKSALQIADHPNESPLRGRELTEIWEKQIYLVLSLALAHVFAEQPADAAWKNREQLQNKIGLQLNQRTNTWGLSVNEVCLHQIAET
jgi:tetratricopeptide (TPR) repeat protein